MPYLELFPSPPVVLPGFPVRKRPTFASSVHSPTSGREVTGRQMVYPLWEFEVPYELLRDDTQNLAPILSVKGFQEHRDLLKFWISRGSQYAAFLYQDPTDYSRSHQVIATADGVLTKYPMVRSFGSGAGNLVEPVGIVDVRTGVDLLVYLDGVLLPQTNNWWIDSDLRTLKFKDPPADGVVISSTFSFFYLCRFIDDALESEMFMPGWWTVKSVKFRSIRPDKIPNTFPYEVNFINSQNNSLTIPQTIYKVYAEISIDITGAPGAGYAGGAGIGSGAFAYDGHWPIDLDGNNTSNREGVFWIFMIGDTPGWGWHSRPPNGRHVTVQGQTIGLAIDLQRKMIWRRNSSVDPDSWVGDGGPFTPDPTTGIGGFTFDESGQSPIIEGPIHLLGGAARRSGEPSAAITLNSAGPFVAPLPTGYAAWGADTWNPSDKSAFVTLSNANKTLSAGTIPGGNVPTAWARTSTSKWLA